MRTLLRAALVVVGVTAAAPAFAQWHDKAYTTRIETRPYYGATVTIESGVRVFRGLPPTRHMIINPNGQTPLQLGIQDTRIFEKSESHNHFYDHNSGAAPVHGGRVIGGPGFGRGKFARRGGRKFKRSGYSGPRHRARPQRRHNLRPRMMRGGGGHD